MFKQYNKMKINIFKDFLHNIESNEGEFNKKRKQYDTMGFGFFRNFLNRIKIHNIYIQTFIICIIIPLTISILFYYNMFSIHDREGMSTKSLDLIKRINYIAKAESLNDKDDTYKLDLIETYVAKMDANSKEKKDFDDIFTNCKIPEDCISELKRTIMDINYDKLSTNNSNIVDAIQNIIKGTITKLDRFNLTIHYIKKLESSNEKKELNKIIKDPETCSTEDPIACIKAIYDKTTEYINADKADKAAAKVEANEKKTTTSSNAATSAQSNVKTIQKPPS